MMILLQATEAVAVAAEQAPKTMGLGELFLAGGFLMWPLLILGGVAVFIFFERFWAIRKASAVDMNFMNRIVGSISARDGSEPPYSSAARPIRRSLT